LKTTLRRKRTEKLMKRRKMPLLGKRSKRRIKKSMERALQKVLLPPKQRGQRSTNLTVVQDLGLNEKWIKEVVVANGITIVVLNTN